jgi:hypothetical protein
LRIRVLLSEGEEEEENKDDEKVDEGIIGRKQHKHVKLEKSVNEFFCHRERFSFLLVLVLLADYHYAFHPINC